MVIESKDKLATALKDAALEPGLRPEFYKTLLDSNVYILIADQQGLLDGEIFQKTGKNISVLSWRKSNNDLIVPIFTSENELHKAVKKYQKYVCMNAKVFFSTSKDSQYVINPLSQYSKELTDYEVRSLLDGSLFNRNDKITLKRDTKVLLSQPKDDPHQLIMALSSYFKQQKKVVKAYITQIQYPELDKETYFLLALESTINLKDFFSEISLIIQDTVPHNKHVDMCQVGCNKEFDSYFKKIKPFYTITDT